MQKITNSTPYRKELKDKILKVSLEQFKSKGVKSVKMDDIASLLSISKRTLYEIYSNKEELLLAGLVSEENKMDDILKNYALQPNVNVMDIIIEFFHLQMEKMKNINPIFFTELHKYNEIIVYLAKRHEQKEAKSLLFFDKGIEEGFFRNDVDYKILTEISAASISYVMEKQLFKQQPIQYLFRNLIFLFLRGICTAKGLEIVDRFLGDSKM